MGLCKLTKSINYRLFLLTTLLSCVGLSRQTCFRNLFQTGPKVIFQFECYPPDKVIPIIPTLDTSSPTDFNELDLSPNYFTNISINDFCQFTNLITLDISYNKLTFISSLFGALECFSQLQTLKANNNQIATPLLGEYIGDLTNMNFQRLDLQNNQIPYIDTLLFVNSDNTSRFPNLQFINLANNSIVIFDLLFPLTIPSSQMSLNASLNPISTLKNTLNLNFNLPIFAYPVVNNRNVNLSGNVLTTFDDSNLLQYGLQNPTDLQRFLNKISNYNLLQVNGQSLFICNCPNGSQLTSIWYADLLNKQLVSMSTSIGQLYCSNIGTSVYVLNFNCIPQAKLSSNSNNFYYSLISLIVIPILLCFILLVCCCCGRPLNKCLLRTINTTCFGRLCRPGDAKDSGKMYDATILYSEFDENWVHSRLKPVLLSFNKPYILHFFTTYHKNYNVLTKAQMNILRSSKRIILVFSKYFTDEEWKMSELYTMLKELCQIDRHCIIITIDMGDLSEMEFKRYMACLEEPNQQDKSTKSKCCPALSKRIKHSLQLDDVEVVHSSDEKFSQKLHFLLPLMSRNPNRTATITDTTKYKTSELKTDYNQMTSLYDQYIQNILDANQHAEKNKYEVLSSPIIKNRDLPLINRIRDYSVESNGSCSVFNSKQQPLVGQDEEPNSQKFPKIPMSDFSDNRYTISIPINRNTHDEFHSDDGDQYTPNSLRHLIINEPKGKSGPFKMNPLKGSSNDDSRLSSTKRNMSSLGKSNRGTYKPTKISDVYQLSDHVVMEYSNDRKTSSDFETVSAHDHASYKMRQDDQAKPNNDSLRIKLKILQ